MTLVDDTPRLVGLIGGLGPAATIYYYRCLIARSAERGVNLRLLLNHAKVAKVLAHAAAGEEAELGEYLSGLALELERGGASLVAVGAATAHFGVPLMTQRLSVPVVDLVPAIEKHLAQEGIARYALMGTRAVMTSALFGRLAGAVQPGDAALTDHIHDLYVGIVAAEAATPEAEQGLAKAAKALLQATGAEAIVLAGTELALVPQQAWGDLPVINCADVHVEAILDAAQRM